MRSSNMLRLALLNVTGGSKTMKREDLDAMSVQEFLLLLLSRSKNLSIDGTTRLIEAHAADRLALLYIAQLPANATP